MCTHGVKIYMQRAYANTLKDAEPFSVNLDLEVYLSKELCWGGTNIMTQH